MSSRDKSPARSVREPALKLYEEFHPFGTTAYAARDSAVEVSAKRYRYIGKERDEETGLYQCGARYLAAWLGGFWRSSDVASGFWRSFLAIGVP